MGRQTSEPPRELLAPLLAKPSWGCGGSAPLRLARRGGSDTPARPKGLHRLAVELLHAAVFPLA